MRYATILLCGALMGSTLASEPVKVTPRFVDIKPITLKNVDREGFMVRVAWETENGKAPNTVGYIVRDAIQGWEFAQGNHSWACENAPVVGYNCTRPKSNIETLYWVRYNYDLKGADNRYAHPKPRPFSEIRQQWKSYISIEVKHAHVWSEAEMVEDEFTHEVLNQEMRFVSSIDNGLLFVDRDESKPLIVRYWDNLPQDDIKRGSEMVRRLATKYGIDVAIEADEPFRRGAHLEPEEVTLRTSMEAAK